jgi:hypothetical protein
MEELAGGGDSVVDAVAVDPLAERARERLAEFWPGL